MAYLQELKENCTHIHMLFHIMLFELEIIFKAFNNGNAKDTMLSK
jgi:hypothetical protein